MVTILYLRHTNASESMPNVRQSDTPATMSWWEVDSSGSIAPTDMLITAGSSATTHGGTNRSETAFSVYNHWLGAWISPPLNGNQTISGTMIVKLRQYEGQADHNSYPYMHLYVWKGDDSGVRGILFDHAKSATECPVTAALTTFWNGTAISNVNALDGDRIVVEIMSQCLPGSTGNKTVTLGFDGAVGGGSESYVEFSADLVFQSGGAAVALNEGIAVKAGGYKDSVTGTLIQPRKNFWMQFTSSNSGRPQQGLTALANLKKTFHKKVVVHEIVNVPNGDWSQYFPYPHTWPVKTAKWFTDTYNPGVWMVFARVNGATVSYMRGWDVGYDFTLDSTVESVVFYGDGNVNIDLTSTNNPPGQGIYVSESQDKWTFSSLRKRLLRVITQGMTVTELNSGAIARVRKIIRMTFKNAAVGASRGRQSIAITPSVSGRKFWKRVVQGVTSSASLFKRFKKKITIPYCSSVFVSDGGWSYPPDYPFTPYPEFWRTRTAKWFTDTYNPGVLAVTGNNGGGTQSYMRGWDESYNFTLTRGITTGVYFIGDKPGGVTLNESMPAVSVQLIKLRDVVLALTHAIGVSANVCKRFKKKLTHTTTFKHFIALREIGTVFWGQPYPFLWDSIRPGDFQHSYNQEWDGWLRMDTSPSTSGAAGATVLTEPGFSHICAMAMWISPPLKAQTIGGNLSWDGTVGVLDANANAYPFIYAYVWKSDNSGVRGVLVDATQGDIKASSTSYSSGIRPYIRTAILSSVGALENDRLIIEVMTSDQNTLTSSFYHGAAESGSGAWVGQRFEFTQKIFFNHKRSASETLTVGHLNIPPLFRLRFKIWKRLVQSTTITDRLMKRFKKRLPAQSLTLSAIISKRKFWKRITQSTTLVAVITKRKFWKRLNDSIRATANLSKRKFWKRIVQAMTFRMRAYPNGRVIYYNMETLRSGKIKNIDEELTVNDQTINGATPTASGKIGGAYQFNGTSDYTGASTPGDINATFIKGVTLSAWIKPDTVATATIISRNGPYHLGINGNKAYGAVCYNPGVPPFYAWPSVVGSTVLEAGQWYHLVLTYDYTDIRIYVDGILDCAPSALAQDLLINGADLNIGWDQPGFGNYFDGTIDEVSYYKRGLTGDEVRSLYFGYSGKTKPSTLSQAIAITSNLFKRMKKRLPQTTTFSALVTRRKFWRKITQSATLSATISRRKFWKKIAQTFSLTASLVRKKFWKRIVQGATVRDVYLRVKTGRILITQALTVLNNVRKHLTLRLGVSHLFELWNHVVWASDGETITDPYYPSTLLDCSRNDDYYMGQLQSESGGTVGLAGAVPGKYGMATRFDDSQAQYYYVQNSNTDIFQILDELSIVVWFKTTEDSKTQYLIEKLGDSGISTFRLQKGYSAEEGCKFVVMLSNGVARSAPILGTGGFLADGRWHMAVGTFSKSAGYCKCSVDGGAFVLSQSAGGLGLWTGNGLMRFGGSGYTVPWLSPYRYYLNGDIDDAIYFKKALSIEEVQLLYNARVGLNLNVLNDRKPFWGPQIIAAIPFKRYTYITQALTVIGSVSKRFKRRFFESFRVSASVFKRFKKKVSDGIKVTALITGRNFWKRISQSARVVDTFLSTRGSKYKRSYQQGITVTDRTFKKFRKYIAHALNVSVTINRRKFWKRMPQALRATDNLTRRNFWKRIRQSITLTVAFSARGSQWVRKFTQGMTTAANLTKQFFKRLGLEGDIQLWDSLVWACDMETSGGADALRDACRSPGTYYKLDLHNGPTVVLGKYGNCTKFVKTSAQHGEIANSTEAALDLAAFTVTAWVKMTGFQGGTYYSLVFSWKELSWTGGWNVGLQDDSDTNPTKFGLSLNLPRVYKSWSAFTSATTVALNQWCFCVWEYDPATVGVRFSVNGAAFETFANNDAIGSTSQIITVAARRTGVYYLDGLLEDLMVFNRALTIDEVRTIYGSAKGLNLNDYSDRKHFYGPRIADNVLTWPPQYAKKFTEAARVVDTFLSTRGSWWVRKFVQGVTATSNLKKRFNKLLKESLTVTATFLPWVFWKKVLQGIRITDNFSRRASFRRAFQQGLTAVAAITRKGFWKKAVQTWNLSATISRRNFWKRISQSMFIVGNFTRRVSFRRAFQQGVTVRDNLFKRFRKRITDAFKVTDVLRKKYLKILSGPIRITDNLARRMSWRRGYQQGITVRDNLRRRIGKRIAHALRVAATLTRINFWKRIRETASFLMTLRMTGRMVAFLSQGITVVANVAFSGSKWVRKFVQGLRVTGTVRRDFFRRLAQGVAVADRLYKRFKKVISSPVRITDYFGRFTSWLRKLQQGMTVSDRVIKRFVGRLSQAMKVVESLKKRPNKFLKETATVAASFITRGSQWVRKFAQGIRITATLSRRNLWMHLAQSISIAGARFIRFTKRIRQDVTFGTTIVTLVGEFILKLLAQPLRVVGTLRFDFVKRILQNIQVTAFISYVSGQFYLKLVEGVRVIDSYLTFGWFLRLIQSLFVKEQVTVIRLIIPVPTAPWLGSFPRPSSASITIQLTRADTGVILSGATVTASIYRPDNGVLSATVSCPETATPGVYKGYFPVRKKDPIGAYPVTIRAIYGGAASHITQEGYIIVYIGTPTGISYH